ncbi:MAG: M23 family metallopeptidase [Candidatus Levyibacteriota bacterium]
MSVVKLTKHAYQGATTAKTIMSDPFGFAIDTLIRVIVRAFIPLPFVSEIAIYFKGPILTLLAGGAVFFITILFIIITTLYAHASALQSVVRSLTGAIPVGQDLQVILKALEGYIEAGFVDTNIPGKDPFGGNGESYSIRTAGFHDPGYYQQFGLVHEGQDLVPSSAYYANNKAYQTTGQPIVFATLTGSATTYTDSYGALTVAITNSDGTIQTVYKHFKQILACNCQIHAGQPIGIMGETGFAFGEHLHYEVRLNQEGNWVAVNPLDYIH